MTDPLNPTIPQDLNPSTPEPLDPGLPEMTRLEGSFHASVAGSRAAKAATAQGNDPAHTAALGTAACGGRRFGPLLIPLPCAFSALAVPALSALLERHELRVSGLQSDALFIAAFAEPQEVYRLAITQGDGDAAKALLALADKVAIELLHREVIDAAVDWCMEAFGRLNGVKKPQAPIPAQPPASPTSTGSPRSRGESTSSDDSPPPLPTTAAAPAGSSV